MLSNCDKIQNFILKNKLAFFMISFIVRFVCLPPFKTSRMERKKNYQLEVFFSLILWIDVVYWLQNLLHRFSFNQTESPWERSWIIGQMAGKENNIISLKKKTKKKLYIYILALGLLGACGGANARLLACPAKDWIHYGDV